jgi:hypothetical protein
MIWQAGPSSAKDKRGFRKSHDMERRNKDLYHILWVAAGIRQEDFLKKLNLFLTKG